MHEICKSFDCNPPKYVRGIFLNISTAFGRVWHDGRIYKIQQMRPFNHHIKENIININRGIGVIKKSNNTLPQNALLTNCKSFDISKHKLW